MQQIPGGVQEMFAQVTGIVKLHQFRHQPVERQKLVLELAAAGNIAHTDHHLVRALPGIIHQRGAPGQENHAPAGCRQLKLGHQ